MSATIWPNMIYPQPIAQKIIWTAQPAPEAPSEVIVEPTPQTVSFQAASSQPNFTTYVDSNVTQEQIYTEFSILDLRLAAQDKYGFPKF